MKSFLKLNSALFFCSGAWSGPLLFVCQIWIPLTSFSVDSFIWITNVVCESHSVVSDSLQPHGLYSPWNFPGQNTGVVSLSHIQWTRFCQNSPPWPICLGWPHMAWLNFIELDKAVVHVIRLASCLWLWFQSVCPLMPSVSAYHPTWVSLTLDAGYLFTAASRVLSNSEVFFPQQPLETSWSLSVMMAVTIQCMWNFHTISLAAAAAAKSLQSCPTPSDPMDCSPPGSSVHGILQARVLEWGAIAFSNFY